MTFRERLAIARDRFARCRVCRHRHRRGTLTSHQNALHAAAAVHADVGPFVGCPCRSCSPAATSCDQCGEPYVPAKGM